jgi:hypothetical protein
MTAFRSKALLALSALALAARAAFAVEPAGPEARTLNPAAGDRSGANVEIIGLSEVDPSSVGTKGPSAGGLGPRAWATLTRADLIDRLERLPALERSPVMRDLALRALLTAGAAPKGKDGPPWLAARLDALLRRGEWEEAAAMAARAPATDLDAQRAGIEARMLMADDASACSALRALTPPPDGPFWAKARAWCQIVAGDTAAAQLSLEVLRETQSADADFFAAAALALEATKPSAAPNPQNPIHFAMWRKAGLAPAAAAQTETPAQAEWVRAASADGLAKLSGVGLLVRWGLRTSDELIQLSNSGVVNADQKDDPEEAAKKLSAGAGDALYLRSIQARTVPAAKASAFVAMLQRTQSRGEFPYGADLLSEQALAIAPLPETAWAAPDVARVLIYTGQVARAEAWRTALSEGSPSDQPVLNAIQIYGWLKQPSQPRAAALDKALNWLALTASRPGPNKAIASARLNREAPVLAALGVVLPVDALAAADANSPGLAADIGTPALLAAMADAADQGAAGEVVLNASLLLKGQGAAAARSQTVAAIVRALMKLGLKKEAKALALEALLGAGSRLER